jgi:TAG lipase / steryl ester hydrolase / phospholipase A2 / LPA acyltransferase
MTRLAEMFNVNHFIVSQVNPHVVPFLAREEEFISAEAQQNAAFTAGPTWIHNLTSLARGEALHRLHVLSELGIFPNYLTKARSVLNQRYSGDITILPSISYAQFPKVLSNPTTEYMLQSMLTGERATWPKLSRVQNHLAIELALDEAIRQSLTRVVFSPSQIDLRLNNLGRPVTQGNDRSSEAYSTKPVTKKVRIQRVTTPSTLPKPAPNTQVLPVNGHSGQPPPEDARPYLPNQSFIKHERTFRDGQAEIATQDALSSSTNPNESSTDSEVSDADTSDVLSSPSPLHSPMPALPDLWPTTRQLFPFASQPTTPLISAAMNSHRSNSFLDLQMTSNDTSKAATPSSPELRYKRLFHPPSFSMPKIANVYSEIRDGVVNKIQSLDTEISTLRHTESLPESQKFPPAATPRADSLPAAQMEQDYRHSRRGSSQGVGLGLRLDISGTRGMMLRRKKSSVKVSTAG